MLSKKMSFVLEKSAVLEVIFYQTTEELMARELCGNPLIICPSPLLADGVRRLISGDAEVITISKWVTDYLKTKKLKRSNKADLMLRLSSVWRHYFPNEEGHLFFKSFELFTDLRSFTLNLEMLSEFLKEFDAVTAKSILIFWTFLQNEHLIDEHLSYQILSDMDATRPLWIMGFKHLSGIQIDMLKLISEKTDVSLFFPKDIYDETLPSDWIRWLVSEGQTEEYYEKNKDVTKITIVNFPKNKLNVVLGALKKAVSSFDVVLANRNVTLNFCQEVLGDKFFLKSQEDLFRPQREKLFDELNDELQIISIELADLFIKIEERKNKAILMENFILYKTLLLLSDALVIYGEFQTTVDLFTLKVLQTILELNSPRVALATLTIDPQSRLLELNELLFKNSCLPLAIIASSSYGPLKSEENKYSEKMLEILRAIAPIKRSGLDFLYLKNELREVLSKAGNVLLLEEGLDLVDLSWREILKDFEWELLVVDVDYQLKNKKDYLLPLVKTVTNNPKNVSASKIQSFIDCPRKYYFSYVEKMDHRPSERLKVAPDEMGTIEHEIIEKYFSARAIAGNSIFLPAFHEEICRQVFDKFISEKNIILSEKAKLSTFYELSHYTKNGIEFLIDFCNKNFAKNIEFEHPLGENAWGLVGSIDCLIHFSNDKIALFDFKRSTAAIGSKRETVNFEKIQIWVYLLIMLKEQGKTIQSWGYLNLSEIEMSQIYNEDEVVTLKEEVIDNFTLALIKVIEELKKEIYFSPKPRHHKICDFCEVELFCSKRSCA